ncbi:MAG: hypothetical protein RIB80_01215 [Rhodospirillales bacterium]
MTDSPKARQHLFRAVTLKRYRGPVAVDTPHILPRRHPWLVIAAAVIALVIFLIWA